MLKIRFMLATLFFSLLCACTAQARQSFPGFGIANGLDIAIVKVTTNPPSTINDTIDTNGPVGGNSVSIYVRILYDADVSNIGSVTVNIHEANNPTPVTSFVLNTCTPLSPTSSGDNIVYESIYTGTWNTLTSPPYTATNPMIYNDSYCFQATTTYQISGLSATALSGLVTVPVKNLWITDANPAKAFFLLEAGQTQQINVDFDHYLSSASYYSITYTIYFTWKNSTPIYTETHSTVSEHSDSLTFDPGKIGCQYGGYFCYDIKITYNGDSITYCSPTCSVTQDALTSPDCNDVSFQYSLSEIPLAGSIEIDVFSNLQPQGSATGLSNRSDNILINIPPDAPSTRAIISGKDNHTDNRGKTPQQFLPCNGSSCFVIAYALYFVLNDSNPQDNPSNFGSSLNVWSTLWYYDDKYNPNNVVNFYGGWRGKPNDNYQSYIANTSYHLMMNSSNRVKMWTTDGPNPEYNTIKQNYEILNKIFHPSIALIGTPTNDLRRGSDGYDNLNMFLNNNDEPGIHVMWSDYIWRAGTTLVDKNADGVGYRHHPFLNVGDEDSGPFYSTFRYTICPYKSNYSYFESYDKHGYGGTTLVRRDLAIHEDTNWGGAGGIRRDRHGNFTGYITSASPGSAGCLATLPGLMTQVDTFLQNDIVNRTDKNNDNDNKCNWSYGNSPILLSTSVNWFTGGIPNVFPWQSSTIGDRIPVYVLTPNDFKSLDTIILKGDMLWMSTFHLTQNELTNFAISYTE